MTLEEATANLDRHLADFRAGPTPERQRYVNHAMQYYMDAWIKAQQEANNGG